MCETELIINTSVGSDKHDPEKSKIEDCDTASGLKLTTFSNRGDGHSNHDLLHLYESIMFTWKDNEFWRQTAI